MHSEAKSRCVGIQAVSRKINVESILQDRFRRVGRKSFEMPRLQTADFQDQDQRGKAFDIITGYSYSTGRTGV